MQSTRRNFIGGIGTAAAALAGTPHAKNAHTASDEKCLFWIAAVTPCDKNLQYDEAAYRDILAYFKDQGADGVVVLGTTGEYPSFSVAERKRVAETALKHRNGLNIIVSPGTCNFPETIELSQHAAEHGADGLLVIPPFYYKKPPLEGLTKYYSLLFEKVKIPINLYHIPGTSAVPISLELLHSLEKYPNLAGIKDSSGDAAGYKAFVSEFPKLNMRTGTGNNLETAFENGMGAILAEGNLFTKQIAAVFAAKRTGQSYEEPLKKLRASQQLLRPAGVNSYGPMKYALSQLMNSRQTYQRPPHLDVTEEQKTMIRDGLAQVKQMT
jgi:4-hydroxy-tetrahydrodipicolinate synthase